MFGFSDVAQNVFLDSNHILLLLKHFTYITSDSDLLLLRFFINLQKAYTTEQKISRKLEKKNYFTKNGKKFRIIAFQIYLLHKSRAGWVALCVKFK